MSHLNAFVGHSFLEEDEGVVRRFLDYFHTITGVVPSFSWEHAKRAEPVELAEKVKRLLDGKNLFIGICTRREAIAPLNQLKPSLIRKSKLVVPSDVVEKKTSDWILQEIGFAVGRGMNLILLVEVGVRTPGGLQGDIEYIPFQRNALEKCFPQMLEMIQAMLPDTPKMATAIAPDQTTDDKRADKPEKEDEGYSEPQDDWDRSKYESAFMSAVSSDDEAAEKISSAFRKSKIAKEAVELAAWEAAEQYWRISLGKGGSLKRLEEIAEEFEDNSEVQNYLGFAYVKYSKHDASASCFERAARATDDDSARVNFYRYAARAKAHANDRGGVDRLLSEMKSHASKVKDGQAIILAGVRDVAKVTEEDELWLGASEALLDFRPDDRSIRFQVAYKYSNLEQRILGLAQYLKIPVKDREDGSWNNLGVELENANLPYRATLAYQKSEGFGGTLATSNLAYKLINVGFLAQAEAMCKEALGKDDCHKSVVTALSRIGAIPDEEEKKLESLLAEIEELEKFWLQFGMATMEDDFHDFDGTWQAPNYELVVTTDSNSFLAIAQYEVTGSALSDVLFPEGATASKPKVYKLRYKGRITGRAIVCDCTRELIEGKPSTRGLLGNDGLESWRSILYVTPAHSTLKVCDRHLEKHPSFSDWQRTESHG